MEKSEFIQVKGRNFSCQLCDIKITSEKAVEDHLGGKKHLRLLNHRTSRQQQTERSVFVGGLSKLNGEPELEEYFSTFGEVTQIIIDKEKAHYAILQFTDQESAEKAAKIERQVMNGQKIVVRPRQPKASVLSPPKSSRNDGRTPKGSKPLVAPRGLNEALAGSLQQEQNISDQMAALVRLTELSPADVNLRRLVCDLLQSVLEEFLPGCHVAPFGSSVNGFGVQGCDLDVQLILSESSLTNILKDQNFYRGDKRQNLPIRSSGEPTAIPMDATRATPLNATQTTLLDANSATPLDATTPTPLEANPATPMHTTNTATPLGAATSPPSAASSATPLDILSLVCDIIKRCAPSCHNVHTIPSSRLPVVKFTHRESQLKCDLSLNNGLALRNTKLLHHYSVTDKNVRPLVFAIRHWAKLRLLAGNAGAGPRLTNYALTLMVLFYLQSRERPVIASVAELEQSGYGSDYTISPSEHIPSKETAGELLSGFFTFYAKFDFATTVICPLLGMPTSLSKVLKTGQACDEPKKSFKIGPVNIQDPFELWHNVALNVNERTAESLSDDLGAAAKVFQDEEESRGNKEEKWGLLGLYDEANYSSRAWSSSSRSPSVCSGASEPVNDNVKLEINLTSSCLSEQFVAEHPDPGELKLAWCKAVKVMVHRVLAEALRFDCRWVKAKEDLQVEESDISPVAMLDSSRVDMSQEDKVLSKVVCDDSLRRPTGCSKVIGTTLTHRFEEDVNRELPPPSKRCKLIPKGTSQSSSSLEDVIPEPTASVPKQNTYTDTVEFERSLPLGPNDATLECTAYHHVWLGRRKARRQLLQSQCRSQKQTIQAGCGGEAKTAGSCTESTSLEGGTPPRLRDSDTQIQATGEESSVRSSANIPHGSLPSQNTTDHVLLEGRVTDVIVSQKAKPMEPILRFGLHSSDSIAEGNTRIVLDLRPVVGETEFKLFVHFFAVYIKKILGQCRI